MTEKLLSLKERCQQNQQNQDIFLECDVNLQTNIPSDILQTAYLVEPMGTESIITLQRGYLPNSTDVQPIACLGRRSFLQLRIAVYRWISPHGRSFRGNHRMLTWIYNDTMHL